MRETAAIRATASPMTMAAAATSHPRLVPERDTESDSESHVPGNPPPGGIPASEPRPTPTARAAIQPQDPARAGLAFVSSPGSGRARNDTSPEAIRSAGNRRKKALAPTVPPRPRAKKG